MLERKMQIRQEGERPKVGWSLTTVTRHHIIFKYELPNGDLVMGFAVFPPGAEPLDWSVDWEYVTKEQLEKSERFGREKDVGA